jgi:hypothetical protein
MTTLTALTRRGVPCIFSFFFDVRRFLGNARYDTLSVFDLSSEHVPHHSLVLKMNTRICYVIECLDFYVQV